MPPAPKSSDPIDREVSRMVEHSTHQRQEEGKPPLWRDNHQTLQVIDQKVAPMKRTPDVRATFLSAKRLSISPVRQLFFFFNLILKIISEILHLSES